MTDRINALTVILDRDIRDDDVQELIGAISMLRNVADVTAHIANIEDAIARSRVRRELRERIIALFD